jgi:hypothetical protein
MGKIGLRNGTHGIQNAVPSQLIKCTCDLLIKMNLWHFAK